MCICMCVEFLIPQVAEWLACAVLHRYLGCGMQAHVEPMASSHSVPLSPIPLSVLFLPSFLPASSMWSLSSLFKQRRVTQNGSARMVGWVSSLQATLSLEVVMR